jgi:hypothetical protein
MKATRSLVLFALTAGLTAPLPVVAAGNDAAEAVDRYLEAVGGRAVWASARGEYVLAMTTDPRRPLPYTFELCWDFSQPRTAERARFQSRTQRRGYAGGDGWSFGRDVGSPEGTLRTWSAEEGAANESLWRAAFEVVTHRLAARDPELSVRSGADEWAGWIEIAERGAPIARLLTDEAGAPQRYRRLVDDTSIVFGPLVDRGAIRFPQNGAFDPGARFEVIAIELYPDAPQAVFRRPDANHDGSMVCR